MIEIVRIALNNLRVHRLRSALTVIGVTIGAGAVVLLVGIGIGLQESITTYFSSQANMIYVEKTAPIGANAAKDLKDSDVRALVAPGRAPNIADATPVITGPNFVRYGSKVYTGNLRASETRFLYLAHREVIAGDFYTDRDVQNAAPVVVLGSKAVTALFDGDPDASIGKKVVIGRTPFTVIGALRSNGEDDDSLAMPISAARAYLVGRTDVINRIIVRAVSVDQVESAGAEITEILSDRHDIRTPEAVDFSQLAFLPFIERARDRFTQVALNCAVVAGLALLIGAVGVANIMLVSVTERTREIGIRRAVGARRHNILVQFLVEAAVLTGIGGLAGVVLGAILTLMSGPAIDSILFREGLWSGTISVTAMVIAFFVSLIVGVLAGIYPANHASRQDPIEALRYE